jgi:hypothetical protein
VQTSQEVTSRIVYRIDSRDRLIEVDDGWRRFAEANRAWDLAGDSMLGCSLWDFIQDAETREIFLSLLARVRSEGISVSLPLRCDSPDTRRYLRLTLSPVPDDGVEFVSETIRTEKRSRIGLLEVTGDKTKDFVQICSWCKRVAVPGGWTEVEFAIAILGLFDESPLPQLSHSICPDCRKDVNNNH